MVAMRADGMFAYTMEALSKSCNRQYVQKITKGRAAIPPEIWCGNWFPGAGHIEQKFSGRKPPILYFNFVNKFFLGDFMAFHSFKEFWKAKEHLYKDSPLWAASAAWTAAEEKFTSINIGSPKLPQFNKAMNGLPESRIGTIDDKDYMRGAKHMYKFIERQLREGA